MNITKAQIAEVRQLAYAARESIAKTATGPIHTGAVVGNLALSLDDVRTNGRSRIVDTYRVDGKITAKAKINAIAA